MARPLSQSLMLLYPCLVSCPACTVCQSDWTVEDSPCSDNADRTCQCASGYHSIVYYMDVFLGSNTGTCSGMPTRVCMSSVEKLASVSTRVSVSHHASLAHSFTHSLIHSLTTLTTNLTKLTKLTHETHETHTSHEINCSQSSLTGRAHRAHSLTELTRTFLC